MNLSKCSRRLSPSSSERSSDGDGEVRTLDPLLARQVLSQLSYIPMCRFLRRSRLLQSPKTLKRIWQPPALPGRLQPSTIDAEGLNFCVRDGNRWNPFAIVTGNGIITRASGLKALAQGHLYASSALLLPFRAPQLTCGSFLLRATLVSSPTPGARSPNLDYCTLF